MYGYLNQLLYVDLSSGEWWVEPLVPDYVRDYIGGRGLGARYLFDLLPAGVDPLGPENVAIMMAGPLTGTEAYSCHKYEWITKSPLTRSYLCSNCGGMLGVSLRKAGYDGIVLMGAAERPCYLYVDESGVELRDAGALWGEGVSRTQELLRNQLGPDASIGCIGPSGEFPRSVRFAGFFDGQRSAGRGGLGAVLGSKGLKGIAIMPGEAEIPICAPWDLDALLPALARDLKEDKIAGSTLPAVGTMIWIDALALNGLLPGRNYQISVGYDEIRGRLDSETYRTRFIQCSVDQKDREGIDCYRCPLRSAKICALEQEQADGRRMRGPEFQSAWALGVNCGLFDYPAILAAYSACNDYGVDAISMGGTIGFAMECVQRGLLDVKRIARDYGGLRLEWGNSDAVERMIQIVAERKGWLGALLADGVRAASERIPGSAGFALHVKGMEFPSYDPRGNWGMALTYATSSRGACHTKAWSLVSDGGMERSSVVEVVEDVVAAENLQAVLDSALLCTFASNALSESWTVSLLKVVSGMDVDVEEYGARICDLERLLAVREGFSARDDRLPPRILEEPVQDAGRRIEEEVFERMRSAYYALRGWSEEGIPRGWPEKEIESLTG